MIKRIVRILLCGPLLLPIWVTWPLLSWAFGNDDPTEEARSITGFVWHGHLSPNDASLQQSK